MEHEHEAIVRTGKITCRTCGQMLESYKEVVGKTQSASSARKIMDEIAISGGYKACGFSDDFVVYEREEKNLVEKIYAVKEKDKVFVIYKEIKTEE